MLSVSIVIFTLFYALVVVFFAIVWLTIPTSKSNFVPTFHKISVIVPLRNEELNIEHLINSLNQLKYPKDYFEVIFVDDFSEDNSVEIIEESTKDFDCTIIKNSNWKGKKSCIEQGVALSKYDFIVQTDGDCFVPEHWLNSYSTHFSEGNIFVFGTVKKAGLFQAIEQMILVGIGAVTFRLGFPMMCNGANMGYKKSEFIKINGFSANKTIASGDDEYLLKTFYNIYKTKVSFIKDIQNVVFTDSVHGLKNFFNQRIRWISKWKHNKFGFGSLLPVFLFVFNTILIISIFFISVRIVLFCLLVKMLSEGILIVILGTHFKFQKHIWFLMPMQLFLPFYIVVMALLSFKSNYLWKNKTMN